MPNKKVFKSLLISLFLLVAGGVKAFSFELFQFSVAPKYAIQNGQMNEYVIYANGHTESELTWDIKWLNLLGINASMGWEMLLLEANCMWGIPKSSGMMCDSDWLNKSNYGMKTDYSESDNKITYLGNLDLRFGLNIKTWDFLHLIPYAGISYDRISFTALGGNYWYGDSGSTHLGYDVAYNDPLAKTGSFGTDNDVITYDRETFNYKIGLKVKYNFFTRFTLAVDFGLAVFTQVNTVDHHVLKDNSSGAAYYLDKMQGFFKSFDAAAEFDVNIWKGLSVGAGFKFVLINNTDGNDYCRKSTETKYSIPSDGSKARASGYYYNIEAFLRYSF